MYHVFRTRTYILYLYDFLICHMSPCALSVSSVTCIVATRQGHPDKTKSCGESEDWFSMSTRRAVPRRASLHFYITTSASFEPTTTAYTIYMYIQAYTLLAIYSSMLVCNKTRKWHPVAQRRADIITVPYCNTINIVDKSILL